jgi:hypothetical protein
VKFKVSKLSSKINVSPAETVANTADAANVLDSIYV